MMKTALLLIDIQNDYFPGGRNPLYRPEEAAAKAAQVLEWFRGKGLPVFFIRHVNENPAAPFFAAGTPGSEIHPSVTPRAGEPIVIKHAVDSFLRTDLRERLEALGVERLVICGMMTHMCVAGATRTAKGLGYDVILAHDACTTMNLAWEGETIPAPSVHKTVLAALQGMFAGMTTAAALPEMIAD